MSPARKRETGLRRYTSVPALLHLLQSKKITLLDPEKWDDRNDKFFMEQFKKKGRCESVLALCFTLATETYHHWRVFTHGSDGACITFRKSALLNALSVHPNVDAGPVKYKLIGQLDGLQPSLRELPFLKRWPYKDEKEFRIVYVDREQAIEAIGLDIDLSCIERITLSPWMPDSLADSLKTIIHSIPDCGRMKVYRTTLLQNEKWKRAATRSKARGP